MSKTPKVLFQRYFQNHKALESQKVTKPTGDNQKPSFTKSMVTNIIGVELEEIAKADKQVKDQKSISKENASTAAMLTNDPHHLVQVDGADSRPEVPERPEALRSRDSLRASENNSQEERASRGILTLLRLFSTCTDSGQLNRTTAKHQEEGLQVSSSLPQFIKHSVRDQLLAACYINSPQDGQDHRLPHHGFRVFSFRYGSQSLLFSAL